MLLFLVSHPLFGCKPGNGTGHAQGPVSIESCSLENDNFNLDIDFFAATYLDNTLEIRLQHTGDLQTFTDGLIIQVRDVKFVEEQLNRPIKIELVPTVDAFLETGPTGIGDDNRVPMTPHESPARATLYLNNTCPENRLAFTDGAGTITFSHISDPDEDDLIEGSFDLTFVDPRTVEDGNIIDRAALSGDFRFHYDRNPQEQPFI